MKASIQNLFIERQVEKGEILRASVLAKRFGVHSATITEVLQKLSNKDLVKYTPYYEISLEASIPIICSLYTLGASPGVIFTLLMTGIITDITKLGTISTVLGRKTAIA